MHTLYFYNDMSYVINIYGSLVCTMSYKKQTVGVKEPWIFGQEQLPEKCEASKPPKIEERIHIELGQGHF